MQIIEQQPLDKTSFLYFTFFFFPFLFSSGNSNLWGVGDSHVVVVGKCPNFQGCSISVRVRTRGSRRVVGVREREWLTLTGESPQSGECAASVVGLKLLAGRGVEPGAFLVQRLPRQLVGKEDARCSSIVRCIHLRCGIGHAMPYLQACQSGLFQVW